jgi:hypothetical protein
MKKLVALLGVVILGISASSMRADGIGMPVAGTLTLSFAPSTNQFNGTQGFTPPIYGNFNNDGSAVQVGSGVEFGFKNTADLITADFTGNTLTFSQSCINPAICGTTAYNATFLTKANLNYTVQSVTFPGLQYTNYYSPDLGGWLAKFVYDGKGLGKDSGTAVFNYTAASAVPEPGTLSLFATGLLGVAGAIRRRFIA